MWVDGRNGDRDIYFAYRPTEGNWGINVQINDDPDRANQWAPTVAVDRAGNAYAAWADWRNGDSDIYFAYRPVEGDWGTNMRANDDLGTAGQGTPSIAVDGVGNTYLIWTEGGAGLSGDVFFAYRPAGGSWRASEIVNDAPSAAWRFSVDIAVDEVGNAYAVWVDAREGHGSDIYFATHPANGTWGTNVKVNDNSAVSYIYQYFPTIAVDEIGNAYAVWTDNRNGGWGDMRNGEWGDIYSADRPVGGNWASNTKLSDDGMISQFGPTIAVDGAGNVYAVWTDERSGDRDIYFAYEPAGGDWQADAKVNDDTSSAWQSAATIAVDVSGNAYAIWTDERNGNYDVYFAYRPAGGIWGANVKVNDDSGTASQTSPSIAVDGEGNAYAVWVDARSDNGDIYFAYRPAGGTWGANVKVNDGLGATQEFGPDITVDGSGNAHAAWSDRRNGATTGETDVYYATRPVGSSWQANVKVNDDTGTENQIYPSLVIDGLGNVYALWRDSDLYFAFRPAHGSWGTSVRVNDSPDAVWFSSALAIDGVGNTYATWIDTRNSKYDVWFAAHPVGGEWGTNVKIGDAECEPYSGVSADIAASQSGDLHIVWSSGSRRANNIYSAQSLPSPEYHPAGLYTSPIFDSGVLAAWETLSWDDDLPAGTVLTFETRSRIPGGQWSAWSASNGPITSPPGQFFQYRVAFSTADPDATPALHQVQVTYRATAMPSAPRLATPCGVTNQTQLTVRGSAAAGATIHLLVDGTEVMATTATAEGTFSLTPTLPPGALTLTVAAENEYGTGPTSDPLALTIDPTLPYDPLGVRAGQWSKDGWLLAPPRDDQGCADPDGWRVWPRPNQAFRVEVPVSYTISAAVLVTVGADSITLTEVTTGTFVGIFEPPILPGEFRIEIVADGQTTIVNGGPVLIDPDGVVYEATGTLNDPVADAQVTLYYSDTHAGLWLPWDAWNYDQVNPQMTLEDGYYSFYTPPGNYRVLVEKKGYAAYTSPDLVVVDQPVRHNVPLEDTRERIYLPLVVR
ncbi:MAG: carboxypeptidase regulatory-like domain-containing protein [Anaerolineae bacterium]|nr:carboxypeptidase regulatory-like domain-containing protein [Anaerolineae bacterium]